MYIVCFSLFLCGKTFIPIGPCTNLDIIGLCTQLDLIGPCTQLDIKKMTGSIYVLNV